ncbi:exonuclease 1 [Culicoides brevitarsis]|uniref:exonuclease 1 n=1 Tax=Culicoides brevitarsis TaxID=469753 RepID=UPI00307C174B
MGITGLIPFVEKASRQISLSDLSGATVAVDAYCWLHKGVIGCAEKLLNGEKTNVHIQYCLKQINHLVAYRIRPILVFDGRHLAAKAGVEAERRESRKAAKTKARELIAAGRANEARSYLQRAVNVSHAMALALIEACHARGIDCIVAPYEADGQLAFLNLSGIVEVVITEDSDLLLFGCKKVLFKFSAAGGLLVDADQLHLAMGVRKEKFTFDKFRQMCILSGCDYLPSLPGIGLAKAKKFLLMTEETDMRRALGKIPSYLGMRQIVVTDEYKEGFLRAEATFRYMVVFDPKERKLTRLNPLEDDVDLSLLTNSGEFFDDETAYQLALGNIDPMSMKTVHHWDPDVQMEEKYRKLSIWFNNKENGHRKLFKKMTKEPPTEEEIQAEHLKSIKNSFLSKLETLDESNVSIQEEEDVMSTYFMSADEPPKKKLRTNPTTNETASPRKSSNIFKSKRKTASPIKSPLMSPNKCIVSLIESVSSPKKKKLFDSPSKTSPSTSSNSTVTPQKDLFALAKQRTEEIVSPAALKLLKMVQEKLQQPTTRRVRVTNEEQTTKEIETKPKSEEDEIPSSILTPEEDSNPVEIVSDSPIDDDSTTSTPIEPTVILIEDDSPMKFTPSSQQSSQNSQKVRNKMVSRPSGLSKRKPKVTKDTNQMSLSHFGFMKNKKL